ncbi:hypothetical protein ACWGMW_03035 [Streptomyces albidoflavus]
MGAVTEATREELIKLRSDSIAPGLAALALDLARAIDDTDAPTAKAAAARELRGVMADVRKLAPVEEEGDALDDLARRREARRRSG